MTVKTPVAVRATLKPAAGPTPIPLVRVSGSMAPAPLGRKAPQKRTICRPRIMSCSWPFMAKVLRKVEQGGAVESLAPPCNQKPGAVIWATPFDAGSWQANTKSATMRSSNWFWSTTRLVLSPSSITVSGHLPVE